MTAEECKKKNNRLWVICEKEAIRMFESIQNRKRIIEKPKKIRTLADFFRRR